MKRLLLCMMMSLLLAGCGDDKGNGNGGGEGQTFKYFRLTTALNPQLPKNVTLTMDSAAGTIEGVIPEPISNMTLVPEFWLGGEVTMDGEAVESGVTAIDFSEPVVFNVELEGDKKVYTVDIWNYTELPIVHITTDSNAPIVDKENWIKGTMRIEGKGRFADLSSTAIEIRGRGNSTWDYPKKPYAIKLGSKAEVAGMPAHKRWVLLAHWNDKVTLRTELAFWLGREYADFDWKQGGEQVELFLNGQHMGGYFLCEHIKVDKNRIPDGYSIEIDAKAAADEPVFFTDITNLPFNVKDPEVSVGSLEFGTIVNSINNFEALLFGDKWLDAESGYKTIADIGSFVDWWLSNEFSKNKDAAFETSCYLNLTADGHIKMGPLWDYDLGWGNYVFNFDITPYINNPEGFWIKEEAAWIYRMFDDPEFVALVKEKWSRMYADKELIIAKIHELAARQRASAYMNDIRWRRLTTAGDYSLIVRYYDREVKDFVEWVTRRLDWMEEAIKEL
ncbi:MAG: CotH kinase family protein [Tidjanibacter sp.]|nr:CotH kinase family protein [Tidjanibacter sp.]